ANSIVSQAIYRGTAFDYLRLTDDREIYFQGIDVLKFTDRNVVLDVVPTDPLFKQQWNLLATDVPDAWRFTTGSNDVLLVSLDTGIGTLPLGVDDLAPSRLLTNGTSIQGFVGGEVNTHGHQSISILSSPPNNSQGVAGINWTSPVLIENVYTAGDPAAHLLIAIIEALDMARENHQRVVF